MHMTTVSPYLDDPEALAAIEKMRVGNPKADPLGRLPDVHPVRIPRHIAVIMDGNGRWAEARGFPRMMGHRAGAGAVREIVDECGRLGVRVVTMYSFSLENWKRPRDEIEALMQLCMTYLEGEREHMKRENIRFKVIGRRRGEAPLPESVIAAIEDVERATAHCTGPTLCLAINYGARAELVDAVRSIASRASKGELSPAAIDEAVLASSLYTGDLGELAEPDLLIRTAGEMRISNFLLWQISYSELYVTDTFWPDFGRAQLHEAIRAFAGRRRRFGGLDSAT